MATEALAWPFHRRLKLYLDERFPLATHLVVLVAFFSCNFLLANHLIGRQPTFDVRAVAVMLTVLLSLFLLRIFDEFKDYELDLVANPDRVVSRGIMPLGELKIMGWAVVVLMLGMNAALGPRALAGYLLVVGFSLAMSRDFFLKPFLKGKTLTTAITHQVITPLLCLYVYIVVAAPSGAGYDDVFNWQLAMGALTGLGWEMSRKIRLPADEQPEIETYSKRLGMIPGSIAAYVVLAAGAACAAAVGLEIGFPLYAQAILAVGALATLAGFAMFWRKPDAKKAKRLSDWAAITMLLSYIAIAVGTAVITPGVSIHF